MNKEYGVTEEQLTSDIPASAPLTVKAKVSPDTGSFSGRKMTELTLEQLQQLDEDIFNLENAKDAIGDVFTVRVNQYSKEKEKQHPDQSVIDALFSELIKLRDERETLHQKTREEIKTINAYYSKISREYFGKI